MKALGTALVCRSRFASLLLGCAALAGPVAVLHGQEPTTNPFIEDATLEPLSPGPSPSDVRGELNSAVPQSGAIFDVGIEDIFPPDFNDWRARMKERGFEFGFAYTALIQNASGGPGRRNAAGGDVDLFGTWRLIGTPEQNAGTLVWAADNRHQLFTELTPGELGPEIGTLFDTSGRFPNERDFALRQLFWQQNLADNKLILSAGKLDAGNYYNGNRASNDNLLALNKSLSANPARFFPQEGIGANVKFIPQDLFFVSAGIHDANASGTETGLNTMFDGDYLYAAEFGLTPLLGDDLEGIYRLAAWYNDPTDQNDMESGWGVGLSVSQFITPTAGVALRYGWQSSDDVEVAQVASAQYLSYVGGKRPKDVWGVGVGWGHPSDSDLDDEFIAEVFYRLQLTRNAQLTPDVQVIANPSNAPDDDVLAVFGVRLRTAF